LMDVPVTLLTQFSMNAPLIVLSRFFGPLIHPTKLSH
jgi:hypothetical protein